MSDYVVLDIETSGDLPWRDSLLAVGIGARVWQPAEGLAMARLLLQRPVTVVAHTNYDLRWLALAGVTIADRLTFHDTKVMAWMLDGTQELDLASLCGRYIGYVPRKPIFRKQGRIMFHAADGDVPIEDVPWPEMEAYNASDLKAEAELYEALRALLVERGLWEHFTSEEAPFSRLLVEMEQNGLPFDRDSAEALLTQKQMNALLQEARLVEDTGAIEFNLASGDQVAAFLYSDVWQSQVKFAIPRLNGLAADEKLRQVQAIAPAGVKVVKVGRDYAYGTQTLDGMGLKPPKVKLKKGEKPKKRPTVSGKLLNVLYGQNPWIAQYVAWKKETKIIGYLKDWIEREHDGRLHGRFDQSGTITGRLAGREPNLQQVASDSGIRDLFRGDLVVGDYGGLEARIAAHFSMDPVMLDVFRSGKDLYGVLAARAWGGPETKENEGRGLMKVVWLASQYGAQGETLAQTMAIAGLHGYTPARADRLLADMKNTVPRLFEWREEVISEARALGYVTTIGGRQRQLADIDSAEWSKMARAERQAVNSKVQGSAADIVRRAMLAIREEFARAILTFCLQVHDEILMERQWAWKDYYFPRIVELCERHHGFELEVPLVFEAKITQSWAAKGGAPGQVSAGAYEHLNAALEGAS